MSIFQDGLYSSDMAVVLAILALGLLIVVHEAGHFFVARWSGMRVERFSLGFGPAIVKWRSGDTQFQIAPIPLGGFVQITGMNPHEEYDEKDPRVYPNRPTYQRFLTIFAGPAMNYVFSIVLIFAVYMGAGTTEAPNARWVVETVETGRPAAGRLEPGDRVLAINGQEAWYRRNGDIHTIFAAEIQKTGGKPVTVRVLRGGRELDVIVAPVWDVPQSGREAAWLVGISLSVERAPVGAGTAAYHAAAYPWVMSGRILEGLYKVVITREEKGEVTGPVGITSAIKDQIKVGWIRAFEVLAMLNVYLGLFNLLPLPALDGGRLVFLGYELATRRRPNPKVEAAVHMVGFLALLVLMILVTFKDIKNLFI